MSINHPSFCPYITLVRSFAQVLILISRSCDIVKQISSLLLYIGYLDSHRDPNAAMGYLERIGSKNFLELWETFVQEDENKRNQKRKERRRAVVNKPKSKKKNDQSSAQRQASRYIAKFSKEQESKLRDCLRHFRETGELSSQEESDVTSEDG
jgi:hypothetical protein